MRRTMIVVLVAALLALSGCDYARWLNGGPVGVAPGASVASSNARGTAGWGQVALFTSNQPRGGGEP